MSHFKLSDTKKLWRFLHFGGNRNLYRPGYKQIEDCEADIIRSLIDGGKEDEVLNLIKIASSRCVKFYTIAYALAICVTHKNPTVSRKAYTIIPEVCKKPTDLFRFLSYCKTSFGVRSWSRRHRKGIAAWYTKNERYKNDPMLLAIHVTKYKRRHGLSQRKVLKSCHPKPPSIEFDYIFRYVTKGLKKANGKSESYVTQTPGLNKIKKFISTVENIKGKNTSPECVIQAIEKWKLTWENIPTHLLQEMGVWRALLMNNMPMSAMIRNLGKMGKLDLMQEGSLEEKEVCRKLLDRNILEHARLHPIQLLAALAGYERGRGLRSNEDRWTVNRKVKMALFNAYSFLTNQNLQSFEKKNILIAIDGKMMQDQRVLGIPSLSCDEAAITLSILFRDSGHRVTTITFVKEARPMKDIRGVDDMFNTELVDETLLDFQTNFDAPFKYAESKRLSIDVFILCSDTLETRSIQRIRESFKKYKKIKPGAKCVNVCFKNSRPASDANDLNMLDVIGVDKFAVEIINDFVNGYRMEMDTRKWDDEEDMDVD